MKKRNKFNLSHTKLASFEMGTLIPATWYETLPGDTIQHSTAALLRTQPLFAPVMHPVHVRIHHWYVPYRLIWDDFEKFITGGPDGNDASVYPTINMPASGGAVVGSLADYLGVPTGVNSLNVSALPFRAYAFIYNEFYRDQDLQPALVFSKASGVDTTTSTALQRVNWEKDYFTSARPWEQKGSAVTLPIGTTAPVVRNGQNPNLRHAAAPNTDYNMMMSPTNTLFLNIPAPVTGNQNITFGNQSGLQADLSQATGATVNLLRQAFALQRFKEARAMYGSRYVEYLRYLGIKSSDGRLDLPEYLSGGKQTIQFSEVLQTAADGTSPVGTMRGHGISAVKSNRYRRWFEEHGCVITLCSIRPKTIYSQGLHRSFNRRSKEMFYTPEFEHIGQQTIENREIFAGSAQPTGTFGFIDRYDEYRRMESSIAAEFRTSDLNMWHLAQIYANAPTLNDAFIRCTPAESRIFPAALKDTIYGMFSHSVQARRMLASRADPRLA